MAANSEAQEPAGAWQPLPFEMQLSEEERVRAASGVQASCMEEKWNVVPRGGELLFLRSWTRNEVFRASLTEGRVLRDVFVRPQALRESCTPAQRLELFKDVVDYVLLPGRRPLRRGAPRTEEDFALWCAVGSCAFAVG